jgi:hypothetical protein
LWFKFYPDKWTGDLELQSCSLEARGYWIDLIAIMHRANPYGTLCISGKEPPHKVIGSLVGCHPSKSKKLLKELESKNVAKRDENGFIYSQFLRELKDKREVAQEYGKQGGNPQLVKGRVNPPVNPPVKLEVESRYKNKEKDKEYVDFYTSYPRHEGKEAGRKAYLRLNKTEQEKVIASLPNFVKAKADTEKKFIPLPATYINQKRYEDYVDGVPDDDSGLRTIQGVTYTRFEFKEAIADKVLVRNNGGWVHAKKPK